MDKSINKIVYHEIHGMPNEITDNESGLFNSFPINEVFPTLKKIFEQTDDDVICSRVFDAILKLQELDKAQFLIELLDTSSTGWRIECCKQLAHYKNIKTISKLCEIARNDCDSDVRFIAVESLGIVGDTTVIETLRYVEKNDKDTDYEGFPISDAANQSLQQIYARIHNLT